MLYFLIYFVVAWLIYLGFEIYLKHSGKPEGDLDLDFDGARFFYSVFWPLGLFWVILVCLCFFFSRTAEVVADKIVKK